MLSILSMCCKALYARNQGGSNMAKVKKKKKQEEIILTPEEKFAQLVALKKATRCILGIEDEYNIYVRLTKDFAELGREAEQSPFEGAEQCASLSEECSRRAEELKRKLPDQKEEISRTVTTTLKEKEKTSGKKGKGIWIFAGILILAVIAVISYKADPTRYLIAGMERSLSLKKYAMESYYHLGDYRDSKEKAKETRYEYASSLEEDGEWEEARELFYRLSREEYQDSADRVVAVEKKIMAEAEPGKTIPFGASRWIVMDKKDGSVFLARTRTIQGKHAEEAPIPGEVYEGSARKVTWDNSSLRSFLNDSFIREEFLTGEQAAIQDTRLVRADNKEYGTKGGKDTTDKVYIMDDEEIMKYAGVLGNKAKSLRLRNPGYDQSSTAYFSHLKEVVYYGFPVDQKGVYNRPVLWVRFED